MFKRVLTLLFASATVVVAAAAASAANPGVQHFHDVGTDVDTNFCDTGATVNITFDVRGTEFLAPNQDVVYRNTVTGVVTFTNPLNGATVVNRFSGPTLVRLISGDPEGVHVEEVTVSGLPELLKTEHGGVLLRDAGYIVFRNTLDGEEFISGTILIDRGPHPDAEADFELFCQTVTAALGI